MQSNINDKVQQSLNKPINNRKFDDKDPKSLENAIGNSLKDKNYGNVNIGLYDKAMQLINKR